RFLRRDPRAALTVIAGDDWYRHISLIGRVVSIEDDPDLTDIDRLARRYTGSEFRRRDSKRVSAWLEPDRWHGWSGGEAWQWPAPQRVAITGVPHAIDSIITSPNGSSHSIGKSVARAFWSSSTFSPCVTSPRYSIPSTRCGSTSSWKYSRSFGSCILPAIFSGKPVSIATATARCAPLSGLSRPRKRRYSPRWGLTG